MGSGVALLSFVKPHSISHRCIHRNSEEMADQLADEKANVELQAPETVHDEYGPQDGTEQERRRREKALIRKLDCFIAPVMMLLMLISYLDRGNIGFAATQGMSADIGLKGSQLNVCMPLIIH